MLFTSVRHEDQQVLPETEWLGRTKGQRPSGVLVSLVYPENTNSDLEKLRNISEAVPATWRQIKVHL